jgi:hypothetical protein
MLKTNGATKPHAAMAAATGPDKGTSSKCNYPYVFLLLRIVASEIANHLSPRLPVLGAVNRRRTYRIRVLIGMPWQMQGGRSKNIVRWNSLAARLRRNHAEDAGTTT